MYFFLSVAMMCVFCKNDILSVPFRKRETKSQRYLVLEIFCVILAASVLLDLKASRFGSATLLTNPWVNV